MTTSSFSALGVPAELDAVLAADGKTEPFPIQAASLPESLAGRDVLGRGRTGSGKTIAFALPLVAQLAVAGKRRVPGRPRGLVLAPTRELATQIAATVQPLAAAMGLNTMTIFGGVGQKPQEQKLRAGVDIVVACPGRLEDLMRQGHIRLDDVQVTVLDEADHMADLGFLPGVTRIMSATPADGQRLLFSATLDRGVDKLVSRFLPHPVTCEVDELSVPAGEMTHRVFVPASPEEKTTLVKLLASGTGRRIMFMRTKHQAKKLARTLTAAGIPAVDLQGNLSQNARERNLALFSADPADGGVRVLVATDVAARGVHVDDVELVVHVDPPEDPKAYLHRSGRTARAGASGTVVTIVLPSQKGDAAGLLKAASIRVPFEAVSPTDAAVTELIGEQAPYRAPDAEAVAAAKRGGRGAKSGSGSPKQGASRQGVAKQGTSKQGGREGTASDRQRAPKSEGARTSNGRAAGGRGARSGETRGSAPRATVYSTSSTPAAQPDRRTSRRASTGDVVRGGSSAAVTTRGSSAAHTQPSHTAPASAEGSGRSRSARRRRARAARTD